MKCSKNGRVSWKVLKLMKINTLIKHIKRKIKGNLKCAIEDGMVVGKNVTVMSGVSFGSEPYLITIGDNVRISSDVIFVNHDGGTWAFRNSYPEYKDVVKFGRIEIGENTFIGCKSIILPGVKIGKNCVIGAGSIVTKDIDDGIVVCGSPAKPVCTVLEYAKKSKAMMPENFDKDKYSENKKEYLSSIL